MSPFRPFTEHPASVGEGYFEHLGNALWFSGRMLLAGLACLVHAVLPFMFVKTGSRTIAELNDHMILHRCKIRSEPNVLETMPAGGVIAGQRLSS